VPARARVRCGPREQRERERGDELEHFYHKSQQLGSAHSIFSKTPGGAAAISSAKPPSPKSSSKRTPRWRERDSNHRSRSCERLFWALPIGDGGTKGGATYRFRPETAMLAWSSSP